MSNASVYLPSHKDDTAEDVAEGIRLSIRMTTGWTPRATAAEVAADAEERGLDLKGDGKLWRITVEEVVDAEVGE